MKSPQPDHRQQFNKNIKRLFLDAFLLSCSSPSRAYRFLQLLLAQGKAARLRKQWHKQGVAVPPVLIASLTNHCNLHCKGCYAQGRHSAGRELSTQEWIHILRQSEELGTSIAILAGGEPFLRSDIFEITRPFQKTIFPIFSNGLLFSPSLAAKLREAENIIPVISIEGDAAATDARRGAGISESLEKAFRLLRSHQIFFGVSITVSRNNFDLVTSEAFINSVLAQDCKLFFFVEYVPIEDGTQDLVLTAEQKQAVQTLEIDLRRRFSGLFVTFPGDEDQYGGCLAAGRGFVHINAHGGLEPCPFAPFSDVNLKTLPLKQALQSSLLQKIRDNHAALKETQGGCALWANREWLESLKLPEHAGIKD